MHGMGGNKTHDTSVQVSHDLTFTNIIPGSVHRPESAAACIVHAVRSAVPVTVDSEYMFLNYVAQCKRTRLNRSAHAGICHTCQAAYMYLVGN